MEQDRWGPKGRLVQTAAGEWLREYDPPEKLWDGFEWAPNPALAREEPLERPSDGDSEYDYDEGGREDYYVRESERVALAEWWAEKRGADAEDGADARRRTRAAAAVTAYLERERELCGSDVD